MSSVRGPSLDPLRFPQRKLVRLREHDYAGGVYFLTICVQGRMPLLGSVRSGEVLLSPVGRIVEDEWLRTNDLRSDIRVDAFVVMPDHFHGIVGLVPTPVTDMGADVGSRAHAVRPYLGRFVAGFKSSCTRQYRDITGGARGSLWQRGYYEHVVRGAGELDRIRRYIANNPRR